MAKLRCFDAHVHFWDPSALSYPWLQQAPALAKTFLPADYAPFNTHSVSAALFVEANCEAGQWANEVAFAKRLALGEPRVAGAVAYVDVLNHSLLQTQLEQMVSDAFVVGVRHNIQGHADRYCTHHEFVEGVRRVGNAGLPFDLCATWNQLEDVRQLVAACPDTQFVMDHCGKPSIRTNTLAPWAASVTQLAAEPNVVCKCSGLLSEASADQWNVQALQPYLDHVVACFGPSRLIYGSDWPVVTASGGETLWRNIMHEYSATWSDAARQDLFMNNGLRFYKLFH